MSNNISIEDLISTYNRTPILYTDADDEYTTPFIQANTFSTIIELMNELKKGPMDSLEIATFCEFEERQSSYYYNAGIYLDLFYKHEDKIYLTKLAKKILKMNEKEQNLELVSCILKHQLFNEMFGYITKRSDPSCLYGDNENTTKNIVKNRMMELNDCNQPLIDRRLSTVMNWLRWIFELVD